MRPRTVIWLVLVASVLALAGCGAAGNDTETVIVESDTEQTDTEETDTEETDTEETDTEETETEETDTEEAAAKFDIAVLEASLKESLAPSDLSGSGDQPKVQKVDCPDDVAGQTGEKFTCDASGEKGLAGSVDVELRNDAGTAYKYEAKLQGEGYTKQASGTISGR